MRHGFAVSELAIYIVDRKLLKFSSRPQLTSAFEKERGRERERERDLGRDEKFNLSTALASKFPWLAWPFDIQFLINY